MAEFATIARPYAEALFKACGDAGAAQLVGPLNALAAVTGDADLRQFADNPKVEAAQVTALIASVLQQALPEKVQNLLQAILDNGRLVVVPEIAAQFQALVNERLGISDAKVYSAYPIDAGQLTDLAATLEQRFGRKLNLAVEVEPELIGGVRVVVGDEVLDTSVKARLEQMKVALIA